MKNNYKTISRCKKLTKHKEVKLSHEGVLCECKQKDKMCTIDTCLNAFE